VRACSVSGSLIQDLKAAPAGRHAWKMEVVEMLTVAVLAFFLMGPIIVLTRPTWPMAASRTLATAPQAGLMAQLAKGIVGGEMAWGPARDRRGVAGCFASSLTRSQMAAAMISLSSV